MSYEFTKLSGVPAVAEFPEGANAIIETNGEIKRCPSSNTPKPLTYDYMPEGYPSKSVQTTTLMEEQELAFALAEGFYLAQLTNAIEIVIDQTYTVNWDGTEYECVCSAVDSMPALGNLSIAGAGNDTGEPFTYGYNTQHATGVFGTTDTAASHTISVKTDVEVITPIAEEFLPAGGGGSGSGQFIVSVSPADTSGTKFKADKTYDEITAAIESGIEVVIHYIKSTTSPTYDVFRHSLTDNGYYQFYGANRAANGSVYVGFINIYEENGEMVVDRTETKLQVAK